MNRSRTWRGHEDWPGTAAGHFRRRRHCCRRQQQPLPVPFDLLFQPRFSSPWASARPLSCRESSWGTGERWSPWLLHSKFLHCRKLHHPRSRPLKRKGRQHRWSCRRACPQEKRSPLQSTGRTLLLRRKWSQKRAPQEPGPGRRGCSLLNCWGTAAEMMGVRERWGSRQFDERSWSCLKRRRRRMKRRSSCPCPCLDFGHYCSAAS